ncbi:MAG: hypothetical protein VX675_03125 [Planctomycetota bacterium]|nr:hypothetical protein [Planctomycetota bacterium]
MSKRITRSKNQPGGHPNQEAGVAGAVEEITASAGKAVSVNRKPMALLVGLALVVMLVIWVFRENQAAKADQLQQELYEIKADSPSNEQVDTWLGKLAALQQKASGQAAEKNTYMEIVDLLIKQAIPAASSTSFLSAPTAGDKPGPASEANKKKMLEKAGAIARDASSKPWADDNVKAWNEQVQKLVDGELNKAWLPESRPKQPPPGEEKAPEKVEIKSVELDSLKPESPK